MSADETKLDQDKVWNEHLSDLNVPAHWAYALGTMVVGFLLMVALIALLGGGGG
jgi:hypothetical protein